MITQIRLEGHKALTAALSDMSNELRDQVGIAVSDTADELQADIVISIQQGAKSGRVYKRGNVTHRASAPGQTPASDTGRLMGSISKARLSAATYTVGTKLAYAVYLEYGTSRMAARPFFRPAVERIRKVFEARLEAAVARSTR